MSLTIFQLLLLRMIVPNYVAIIKNSTNGSQYSVGSLALARLAQVYPASTREREKKEEIIRSEKTAQL